MKITSTPESPSANQPQIFFAARRFFNRQGHLVPGQNVTVLAADLVIVARGLASGDGNAPWRGRRNELVGNNKTDQGNDDLQVRNTECGLWWCAFSYLNPYQRIKVIGFPVGA